MIASLFQRCITFHTHNLSSFLYIYLSIQFSYIYLLYISSLLYTYLSFCLYFYIPSIVKQTHLSFSMYLFLSIYLANYLSFRLYFYIPSIVKQTHLSFSIYLPNYLSFRLYFYISSIVKQTHLSFSWTELISKLNFIDKIYIDLFNKNQKVKQIQSVSDLFSLTQHVLCIPEKVNTNTLHQIFDYKITFVNSTTRKHKF